MIYKFRVDILKDYVKVGEALARSCIVKFDSNAEVMRGIQLDMSEENINMSNVPYKVRDWVYFDGTRYFNNTWCFVDQVYEVQPVAFDRFTQRLRPVMTYNGTDYPLGVYMITTTPETLNDTGNYMQVEGFDETMILKQAAINTRAYLAQGTAYITAIESLLTACGLTRVLADANTATLTTAREWETGTTYLQIVNELLDEINYDHVYADLNGYIHLHKKEDRTTADLAYDDVKNLRIIKPIKRTTDIYNLPNVLVGVVSNPEFSAQTYTATNTNLDSVLSIPRRGYRVTKVYKLNNIASYADLKAYIDRELMESMQTTEQVQFDTFAEGGHEYGTMISIDTKLLSGLYRETAYTINISRTARMTHTLERKIYV